MNQLSLLGFFLLLLTAFTATATSPDFHRVAARSGDGIYSLLRRYELADHTCDINKFYELNQLKNNARLQVGKKYFIPVLLYNYNGKSIRSTVGIDSWQQAVGIQKYNERMLAEKYRRMTFQKSKILWVPYHELNCADEVIDADKKETTTSGKAEAVSAKTLSDVDYANTVGGERQFPIFGKKYDCR